MRSLIIIEVEHGESTDPLDSMAKHIMTQYNLDMFSLYPGRAIAKDYTFRVDLPECFTLEKGE
jgi:hypothetical protein